MLLIAAIVGLSVVPPAARPVTAVPHYVEHFAIFLLAGAAVGIGFAARWHWAAAGVIAFTALIEIVQMWIPGRHARLSDFAVNAAAAGLGLAASMLYRRLARKD